MHLPGKRHVLREDMGVVGVRTGIECNGGELLIVETPEAVTAEEEEAG